MTAKMSRVLCSLCVCVSVCKSLSCVSMRACNVVGYNPDAASLAIYCEFILDGCE